MKKKILFLTILLTFLLVPTFVIGAYSYNYDFFKNPIYSSEGLTFKDAIYDENTYRVTNGLHPKVDKEIVLPPENLHADNHGVALAMELIPENCNFLIDIF